MQGDNSRQSVTSASSRNQKSDVVMRAIVVDESSLEFTEKYPIPEPAKDEALIKTIKVGLSGLDVEACRGVFSFKGVPGHKYVGIVESVQNSEYRNLIGKRVVGSHLIVCGKCDMCFAGLSSHCRHRKMLGLDGRDGCLADYFAVPEKNLVHVPDSIDDDRAVFAISVASAIQVARQLTIEGKPYITVMGDGHLGLICAQILARLNASVRLVGRFSEKLEICEKWGIKHRHIDDIGRRADQDVVVDCLGTPEGLSLATRLVRPRGKIVIKNIFSPETQNAIGESFDMTSIVMNEIEVIGSHSGPVREALGMIERSEVDVISLISKRMRLSDGPAVLKAAAQPQAIKIIVEA